MQRLPQAIPPDGRIAVICPSSPPPADELAHGLHALRQMGFEPTAGQSCYGHTPARGYLAAESDVVKIRDIHWAFADPSIDGILCARGGSGAGRLIRHLDRELIAAHPKAFAGFSDITVLHAFISAHCGFATFHAPMATSKGLWEPDNPSRDAFVRTLTDPTPLGELQNPPGYAPLRCVVPGRARGELVGGNLCVLGTTIGTAAELDTTGKILLVEEVDEEPYSIDRLLNHLLNAGLLQRCAGIVLGDFIDCAPPERYPDRTVETVVQDVLQPLGIPILSGLKAGHDTVNIAVPLGVEVEIDASAGRIRFAQPALRPRR